MRTCLLGFILAFPVTLLADLTADIDQQAETSIQFILDNLNRNDVAPGAVVAAPSYSHPNYYYHWVRDAALTTNVILDLEPTNQNLRSWLIQNVSFLQKTISSASTRANGLGEPKFNVDGSVFTGPWGRPQNDGPALRAAAMIRLYYLAQKENWSDFAALKDVLYKSDLSATSLIKNDLEYVAHNWMYNCFDLWEEVNSYHFYTLMAERKAMFLGAQLASQLGDNGAAGFYNDQFRLIGQDLLRFWNAQGQFIMNMLPNKAAPMVDRSGIDSATTLGIIHSTLNDGFYDVSSDQVLANYAKIRDTFGPLYPINSVTGMGPAFGRYPEDVYDGYGTNLGANPWVLATLAGAELLYRASVELSTKHDSVVVSKTSLRLLRRLKGANFTLNQSIAPRSPQMKTLSTSLVDEADGLMQRVLHHRNPDGSLSEQINRDTGDMQGAPNLSWSHDAFVTAKMARDLAVQSINQNFPQNYEENNHEVNP